MTPELTNQNIERMVRAEWGRVVATLFARLGNLELAEDATQDALIAALSIWPTAGLPQSPRAWLTTVGMRKAIDVLRREQVLQSKSEQIRILTELEAHQEEEEPSPIPDERLALIFTCCHPALSQEASVALTLKTVCGLTTPQIARAYVVPDVTMAQRIVRAKRKIAGAGIPFAVPEEEIWPERIKAVLATIYLVFNEGYAAHSGTEHQRVDLAEEAIRLGRVVAALAQEEHEAQGLVALMLLHHSRRFARSDRHGNIIPLEAQDREKWVQEDIFEGLTFLALALEDPNPGPYTLQAGISAAHARAGTFAETNWGLIARAYEDLNAGQANPVYLLNRAVALSYGCSPEEGLEALKAVEVEPRLAAYQPYHAAKADMLARAGRGEEARRSYSRAIELTQNEAEIRFLTEKLATVS